MVIIHNITTNGFSKLYEGINHVWGGFFIFIFLNHIMLTTHCQILF